MEWPDLKRLQKADNPLLLTSGTIILSLSCAFVGNYDHSEAFGKVKSAADFIAYLLTNPVLWLCISIPTLIISTMVAHQVKKELEDENKNLKTENASVTNTENKLDRAQEDIESLHSKVSELHKNHVKTWLKGIFKQVEFDTYARVSIYYEDSDSFTLLARYSGNPALSKTHKLKFPINQGVLSLAWQHGEHTESTCEEYDSDPDKYIKYMLDTYKYEKEELSAINMKSCSLFGLSITQADENIGVILFESTKYEAFDESTKDSIKEYCKHFESHLCSFVRDGIKFDKSIDVKRISTYTDVDGGILKELGGKNE